jgi:hypothetical protein
MNIAVAPPLPARARARQMTIRGHFSVFSSASKVDEETLADDCVTNLGQLLHASAKMTVVLLARRTSCSLKSRPFCRIPA